MFSHSEYDKYSFEDIPLDFDIFLMSQKFEKEYDKMMVPFFDGAEYRNIGYVSFIAVRKALPTHLELSWFHNINDRYHEVSIHLPKTAFVRCVGHQSSDEKIRLFVKDNWIENLFKQNYSTFSLVDVANFRNALFSGLVTDSKLKILREQLDEIAKEYPDHAFVSFADSILIKTNWTAGYSKSGFKNDYSPERILSVSILTMNAYREILSVPSYSIICQGENRFYGNELLHISPTQNHFCLNSLGIPFEQTQAIEKASRSAIKQKLHQKYDLYLESTYFHSLNWKFKNTLKSRKGYPFESKMLSSTGSYHPILSEDLLAELENA